MDKKNDDNPLTMDDDVPLLDETLIDENVTIRIKCTGPSSPTSDHTITIPTLSMSVLKLKEMVRKKIGPSANGRYLRLIAAGRLLAPDMAPLSQFKVSEGDVLHAVLAAPGVRGGQQAAMARGLINRGTSRTRRIGGFNLRISDDSDDDGDDSDDDIEEGAERRGFDRLRSTGLSRDEISAIRLYFSRQVDRFAEQRRNRSESSDDSDNSDSNETSNGNRNESEGEGGEDETPQSRRERRLRLEEEWMEAQGPASEFRMNLNTNTQSMMMFGGNSGSLLFQNDDFGNGAMAGGRSFLGTDRDFMWGFFLGFFVGFIMLYWVWMPTVSHKQKLGILTGISFQMALNLFKSDDLQDLEED